MNPDDYIEGTHNEINPVNWIDEELPLLTELEEQQNWNMELCEKIHKMKIDFKKLKEIEEMFTTLGTLTFEEQKQKDEILNKY